MIAHSHSTTKTLSGGEMTSATKNFGPQQMEWADIVAPSLWVLQSVHGSIHTVINGCEEKREGRRGWNNVPLFQHDVNSPTRG